MSDEAGDNLKTFADCTAAIERDPNNAESYYRRGMVVLSELLQFSYGREFDSELAERLDNTLIKYYIQAAADLDVSIRLRPDYAPAYLSRGQCEFWNDGTDRAIAFWEKAIA